MIIINRSLLFTLLSLLLLNCTQRETTNQNTKPPTITEKYRPAVLLETPEKTAPQDTIIDLSAQYSTYYIVVAETGLDYSQLHQKMFTLSKTLQLEIDTMGRTFDKKKNLIALPDNAEDEIYAGDYFPRRIPSETLSIEYLDHYKPTKTKKQMALTTGIYETKYQADSALSVIKAIMPNAFSIKSSLYIGCMH